MAEPISASIMAVTAWVSSAAAATATAVIAAGATVGLSATATAAIWNSAIMAGVNFGLSKLLQPQVGRGGSPTSFKADPAAPISGIMGRFGTAGRQIHMRSWGKENLFLSFATVLSLGPIQSVEAFSAAGNFVSFPGPQGMAANVEPYKDKMWMTYKLGLPTDGTLGPPTGQPQGTPAMDPPWTAAHRTTGYAASFWTMRNNSKRASYESGVPRPLWYLLGQKVWDPRYDSTYPGGVGPQRRDDWRTWAWNENPYIHALAWVRGHHKMRADGSIDRTKRLAGVGAPDAAIDIGAFIEGANVCDANAWPIGGEWTTVDDKWQTLASMLQAGGGVPLNRGAQIGCMTNAPRASVYTLTNEDIVGPVSLSVMAARRDRFNTVIPRYRDETYKFEQVAAGEVTSSIYRDEDGGEPRTREVAYNFVTRAKQAAELAAYDIANARETLTGSIPCKPHLLGLRAGDAFIANAPEVGLNGQKFVVIKRSFDPASAMVVLDVRSETDGKHSWALGQTANPPTTPGLTSTGSKPDAPEGWIVTPRPVENGGVSQPGVIVVGTAPDNVGRMLVEYVLAPLDGDGEPLPEPVFDDLEWSQAYDGPATTNRVQISGLRSGQWYWVGITYFSLKGVPSERTHYGPTKASALASDIAPDAPALEDIKAEARAKAELLIKEAAGRWNRDETDKRFAIRNIEIVSEKLATAVQTLQLADQDQIAMVETERTARLDADEAETLARTLQISGVEDALAIVDERSTTTATALTAETEARSTQVSSLGDALAVVDEKATTAVTKATSAVEQTTALVAEVGDIASTVTINAEAIVDLEAQNNIARFDLEAAAGGGKPARFSLVSGPEKTAIALMADRIWHGDNSFWDDASDTMQTLTGDGRRLVTNGPFGALGEMLMWLGPESIAVSDMARGNADFFLARNAPRVGGNDLSIGGGFQGWVTGAAFRASPTTGAVTTTAVTAETSGATGSVSAEWIQVTFNHTGWTIIAPNSPTTGFRNTVGTAEIKSDKFGVIQRDSGTGRTLGMIVVPATVLHNI